MLQNNSTLSIVLFPGYKVERVTRRWIAQYVGRRRQVCYSIGKMGQLYQDNQMVNPFLSDSSRRIYRKIFIGVCIKEDYTSTDLLCVFRCREFTLASICNTKVGITIGSKTVGHVYSFQMRVGSVYHLAVDVN